MLAAQNSIQDHSSTMPRPNKNRNESTNKIITSPAGVPIKITAGRKLKFQRATRREYNLTAVQINILAALIDWTDDGYSENPAEWGRAYMGADTLADEAGCSERTVFENMPKLEELGCVVVTRSNLREDGKSAKGGRNKCNEYWLPGWLKFGIDTGVNGERGSQFASANHARGSKETMSAAPQTMSAAPVNGAPGAYDSPRDTPTDITYKKNSAGPAHVRRDYSSDPEAMNDNWPETSFAEFWANYPNKVGEEAAREAFRKIDRTQFSMSEIMAGLAHYKDHRPEGQFWMNPEKFLTGQRWKDRYSTPTKSLRSRRAHAI